MCSRLVWKVAGVLAALLLVALVPPAAAELRDPLKPPAGLSSSASSTDERAEDTEWKLSWTLLSADRRIARLNGRLVRVGDAIEGIQVVAIESRHVVLEGADGERVRAARSEVAGLRATPIKDDDS